MRDEPDIEGMARRMIERYGINAVALTERYAAKLAVAGHRDPADFWLLVAEHIRNGRAGKTKPDSETR